MFTISASSLYMVTLISLASGSFGCTPERGDTFVQCSCGSLQGLHSFEFVPVIKTLI